MAKALRISLFTLAICLASFLTYSSYVAWSFYYGVEAERTPFSSKTWREKADVYANSSDSGCVRGGMALDIVSTNFLLGKSVTEVKSLLGEPDRTKQEGFYYELGQCSGFGWHDSVLHVRFRNNQQVTNSAILRH